MELLVCAVLLGFMVTGNDAQTGVCGQAPLNNKIVGGENAVAGAWPWQVSLHRSGSHFCGGSLINSKWILTAAHCFSSTSTFGLVVYLGRESQQGVNSNEQSRSVSKVINHPDYDTDTNDNDICLLELSSSVDFTDYIRPVCLAGSNADFSAGTNCWITGWGNIMSGVPLPFPENLQEVQVPIVSNTQCKETYSDLTDNMICAGLSEGGKDSCQGDSGGPLVIQNGSLWVQAGVVSFGFGCAQPNIPGVYARVSQYQSWINSQISTDQPGFVGGTSGGVRHTSSSSLLLLLSFPPLLFATFVLT